MGLFVTSAGAGRQKLQIRGTLSNGREVKISGHRNRKIAEKLKEYIEELDRAKQFGQLPPPHLAAWIERLPPKMAARFAELELLDNAILERRKPIDDLLVEFRAYTERRCSTGARSPRTKVYRVQRLITILAAKLERPVTFQDFTLNNIEVALDEIKKSKGRGKGNIAAQKTLREYIFAAKGFCDWMVQTDRASVNPLNKLVAPAAYGNPIHNRRPLTVDDFTKLARYLTSETAIQDKRRSSWSPRERLITYWTAVLTGFRLNELRALTPSDFDFTSEPVTVTVSGYISKNRTRATVPIPHQLAVALKAHTNDKPLDAPLLGMPSSGKLLAHSYRDLKAAGIVRVFPNGDVVDFHTLRSTAICWWLIHDKLTLLEVQFRARLKTLELVQTYVRRFVPDYARLVKSAPNVVPMYSATSVSICASVSAAFEQ